jgi:hypothetical protein
MAIDSRPECIRHYRVGRRDVSFARALPTIAESSAWPAQLIFESIPDFDLVAEAYRACPNKIFEFDCHNPLKVTTNAPIGASPAL